MATSFMGAAAMGRRLNLTASQQRRRNHSDATAGGDGGGGSGTGGWAALCSLTPHLCTLCSLPSHSTPLCSLLSSHSTARWWYRGWRRAVQGQGAAGHQSPDGCTRTRTTTGARQRQGAQTGGCSPLLLLSYSVCFDGAQRVLSVVELGTQAHSRHPETDTSLHLHEDASVVELNKPRTSSFPPFPRCFRSKPSHSPHTHAERRDTVGVSHAAALWSSADQRSSRAPVSCPDAAPRVVCVCGRRCAWATCPRGAGRSSVCSSGGWWTRTWPHTAAPRSPRRRRAAARCTPTTPWCTAHRARASERDEMMMVEGEGGGRGRGGGRRLGRPCESS